MKRASTIGLTTHFSRPLHPSETHTLTHAHTHSHRLLRWVITTLLRLHKIACKCNQASKLAPFTFSPLSSPHTLFSHRCFSPFLSTAITCPIFPPFSDFTSYLNCFSSLFLIALLHLSTPVFLLVCFFSILRAYSLITFCPVFHKSSLHSSFLFSPLLIFSM